MKHFAIFIPLLMLVGCGSARHASTVRIERDSAYISKQRLDSLFRAIFQRDSTYQRDSVFVGYKGDTIVKYVERTKYCYTARVDTFYRNRHRVDTVYVNRTDSVTVEKPVFVEKTMKWYDRGFVWVGRLCCLAAILWAVFLYLRRKF